MRFGRLGLMLVALGAFSSFAVEADAKKGKRPAPAYNGAASNGARVGPNSNAPTYGPNAPPGSFERRHNMPEIWARNSDPIVAERPNRPGRFYDARTQPGRERGTLNRGEVADARERAGLYDQQPNVVTLGEASTGERAVGLNAGGFEDGRMDILGGGANDPGRLSVDVLRADGTAKAGYGLTDSGGAQVYVDARGQATLVGINGEIGTEGQIIGDLNGQVKGEGEIFIGADVAAIGQATIDRNGVSANGRLGGTIGLKAQGQVTGGLEYGGNSANATVVGEAILGLSANAEGYFKFDWSTWSVKYGGRASVAVGVGAGLGVQGELNLSGVRSIVVDKVGGALASARDSVGSVISSGAGAVSDFFGGLFGGGDDKPPANTPNIVATNTAGSNVPRDQPTLGGTGNDGPSQSGTLQNEFNGIGQRR